MSENQGKKFDQEKLRYDLLPTEAIEEIVKVLTQGAKKYGDRNWELGINFNRSIAAARRHEAQFLAGELKDEETQTIHLANTIVNYLMILQFIKTGRTDLDNMPNALKRNGVVK